MNFNMGSGFKGSPSIQTTTVASQEIIPNGYKFYTFSFANHDSNCTVIINNGEPIFLLANQGFESNYVDCEIHSFKVVEIGTVYNWIGAY